MCLSGKIDRFFSGDCSGPYAPCKGTLLQEVRILPRRRSSRLGSNFLQPPNPPHLPPFQMMVRHGIGGGDAMSCDEVSLALSFAMRDNTAQTKIQAYQMSNRVNLRAQQSNQILSRSGYLLTWVGILEYVKESLRFPSHLPFDKILNDR